MLSHPQPLSELLKKLPLFPHPPQRESKIIIQMMELHPHPLLESVEEPHPHPVAVKSLIALPPKGFVYGLSYELRLVCVSANQNIFEKFFCTIYR